MNHSRLLRAVPGVLLELECVTVTAAPEMHDHPARDADLQRLQPLHPTLLPCATRLYGRGHGHGYATRRDVSHLAGAYPAVRLPLGPVGLSARSHHAHREAEYLAGAPHLQQPRVLDGLPGRDCQ